MNENTKLAVVVAALVALTGGVVGATGPATLAGTGHAATDGTDSATADAAGVAAQETTQGNQTNETTQAESQGSTNVTARNVTVERLVLRNVTVQNAQFGNLTVVRPAEGDNTTNETYQSVTVQRIETTGEVTDLTLENVTITDDSLATALLNESGRQRIDVRLVMGMAVLQNQTVQGLSVESATVHAPAAENVSLSESDGGAAGAAGDAGGQPAMTADSAVVEDFNLTTLNVTGLSVGEEAAATTTVAETTTTAATTGMATTTGTQMATTTPAEAGSLNRTTTAE